MPVDSGYGSGGKSLRSGNLETYARLDGSMLNRREPYSFYSIAWHSVLDGLLLRAGGPRIPRVAVLHFGSGSSVYASIHGVSDEAFVRIDLLRSYMHTRF
jgi:hypothetical protein